MRQARLLLILFVFGLGSAHVFATDGDLDPNFGNGGKLTLDIAGDDDFFHDIAVLVDGSTLAAGESWNGNNFDIVIAKYDSSGNLMPDFGTDGIVITDIGHGADESATALYVLPNNQILVAGSITRPLDDQDFLLLKYNANGSLDTNFGAGGIVMQDISGTGDRSLKIGIQTNNRIIVAGSAGIGIGLAAFTINGDLDSNFGINGIMNLEVEEPYEIPRDMQILDNDQILIAGYVDYLSNDPFLLVRYTANGFPDSNFGNGGAVKASLTPSDDHAFAIALQEDGKIVLGGWVAEGPSDGSRDLALVRFNSEGTLDSDFGLFGIVLHDLGGDLLPGNDEIHDLAVQEDQKILVIGSTDVLENNNHFLLTRFHANGSLDHSFGSHGQVLTNFGPSSDSAESAYLTNGAVIVAGFTETSDKDLAMARYLIGEELPAPGDCDGAHFCDQFNDGILAPDWLYVKQSWHESAGSLTGTPSGKKAITIAPTGWSSSNIYEIQTSTKSSGGELSSVWLLGWYADKKNTVELQIKEANDKWILKHRVNGVIVAKAKGLKQILPNTPYSVKVTFDGLQFQVFVDNSSTALITLQATYPVPVGTVGYQVKNTTASIDFIRID